MILNGELSVVLSYTNFHSPYFWMQMVVGGLCGFAIGYVTSLQIKVYLLIKFRTNAARTLARTVS